MEYQGVNKIGELMEAYRPKEIQVISRGSWLNRFHWKLSQEWSGVVPLEKWRVGRTMKKFPDWELPVIYKLCESANCGFAKCFWGTAKKRQFVKKEKKPKNLTLI
jgi:hypothetical protein